MKRFFERYSPFISLFVTALLAVVMSYIVKQNVKMNESSKFSKLASQVRSDIQHASQSYINGLLQTRGLFEAYKTVDRYQFSRFVGSIDVSKGFPGILGIGYAEVVSPSEVEDFVQRERLRNPSFRIWPTGKRSEYGTTLFLEPQTQANRQVIGFDLFSEPIRREAMERARDTGLPATSGKVALLQELGPNPQPGFLIFVPVYKPGTFRSTLEQRRKNLQGFVYSPFRAQDTFGAILKDTIDLEQEAGIEVKIFDGADAKDANLLFEGDSSFKIENIADRALRVLHLEVAGRRWTVVLAPRLGFGSQYSRFVPFFSLLGGLCISFLLFRITFINKKQAEKERAAAERERSAREEMGRTAAILNTVFKAAPIGLGFLDRDFVFVQINQTLAAFEGVNPKLVLGRRFDDVLPRWASTLSPLYTRVLKSGEPILNVELQLPTVQGAMDFILSLYPVRTETQQSIGVGITLMDISERKSSELAQKFLAESSSRFVGSLDYLGLMRTACEVGLRYFARSTYIDILEEGEVRRVAMAEFGSLGEPRSQNCEEVSKFDASAEGGICAVIRTGHSELVDKKVIHVALTSRGQCFGCLTSVAEHDREYTRRDLELYEELARRASMALENARLYRDAQTANRAKDEFLATLSHELRTPLNAIVGWADLLAEEHDDPEVFAKGIEALKRNARAQEELINDLLDVSRIISGKLSLDVDLVDLRKVAEQATEAMGFAAQAKKVSLRLRTLGKKPVWVRGDSRRLNQVLWNLVSNAVKFTPSGGSVEVFIEEVDGHVRVGVRDSGQGIEKAFLPFVFERFRQQDSTITRRHGGLGLGLAIVRHIVELHGGRVDARSEGLGKGATFLVEFPRAQDASIKEPAPVQKIVSEKKRASTGNQNLKGCQILVVDDAPDVRVLLEAALRRAGAKVTSAPSAVEGLKLLQQEKFDVLISDIGMPEMDGYEFIKQVRELSNESARRIPAAALSAYVREEERNKAIDMGFQIHVGKPVNPNELVSRIIELAETRT